ncbi:putative pectinesterase 67 [Apostasia shenzhenica]|uniref:pectinesterase n=1 Tax=Apostasia shenzhenica TaxID=1088818 RepID=A0A2I0B3F3_9ASPA|nr:putative pectinesterase 67 [Apostasia shenzhenica]
MVALNSENSNDSGNRPPPSSSSFSSFPSYLSEVMILPTKMTRSSSLILLPLLLLSSSSSFGGATAGSSKPRDLIDAPLLTSKVAASPNRTIIVSPSGKDHFTSVQAAIDAVPEGNSDWIVIHLRAGVYKEKVVIPSNKPYIFLRGNGKGRTSIVWTESSTTNNQSATFTVKANDFVAFGVSFKNDAPIGEANTPFNQSVATMVSGDKVAFYHCGFYSYHNTLFDHRGRHFYESCYVQGNIDVIFGRGQSIFQASLSLISPNCEIFVVLDRRTKILGSITAQNRQSPEDGGGFVFIKCKVYGVGDVYLGRAKGAHSRVIFANSYLSKTITPAGWTNWSYDGTTDHLLHGEHSCHGPGADSEHRVQWSRQLTEEEVAPFITVDFINGKDWLPAYYD